LDKPELFQQAVDDVLLRPELVVRTVGLTHKAASEHDQLAVAGRMKQLYEELIEERHALRGHTRR
jgi:hypothetical protein